MTRVIALTTLAVAALLAPAAAAADYMLPELVPVPFVWRAPPYFLFQPWPIVPPSGRPPRSTFQRPFRDPPGPLPPALYADPPDPRSELDPPQEPQGSPPMRFGGRGAITLAPSYGNAPASPERAPRAYGPGYRSPAGVHDYRSGAYQGDADPRSRADRPPNGQGSPPARFGGRPGITLAPPYGNAPVRPGRPPTGDNPAEQKAIEADILDFCDRNPSEVFCGKLTSFLRRQGRKP